jgi:hypothetical protein
MQVNQRVQIKEANKPERFDLMLPARISVLEGEDVSLDLVTQSISADSAFFPTTKPLPEGTKVLVEVTIRRISGIGRGSRVKVKGWVLQSEQDGMTIHFEKKCHFSPNS